MTNQTENKPAPRAVRGPGYAAWLKQRREENAAARRLGFRNYREWQGEEERA